MDYNILNAIDGSVLVRKAVAQGSELAKTPGVPAPRRQRRWSGRRSVSPRCRQPQRARRVCCGRLLALTWVNPGERDRIILQRFQF